MDSLQARIDPPEARRACQCTLTELRLKAVDYIQEQAFALGLDTKRFSRADEVTHVEALLERMFEFDGTCPDCAPMEESE